MLSKYSNIIVYVALGILGFIILIFQVVFVKNLILIFGLTAPAIATLLASFFLGFAAGNFLFGKLSDRVSQKTLPKLFASIFLGIGLYSFASPILFTAVTSSIKIINGITPLDFSGFSLVVFVLSIAYLLVPTLLMGGGFILAAKLLISEEQTLGKKTSILYFIDTLGGVLGAFAAGFILLPFFGNNATIFFAGILSASSVAAITPFAKPRQPA